MCKAKNLITSIEVEIDAPASLVWQVLTDFECYALWNRFCPRIESTLKLGDPVHMHVSATGNGETQPVSEILVAFEPERLLSWEMRPTAENKDAGRRDQYIEALGAGRCRYVSTDIFLGVNADEIMKNHGGWVKAGFDAMALALKARAEALHADMQ
jgi:uncharacterized protein YndB with AHSA1/START domain